MRARKTGRYLALLALMAAIIATVLVIQAGLATSHHHPAARAPLLAVSHRHGPKKRFYRIRAGDTLSTISVKTGVSVPHLQALNPKVAANPNALQTGQSLRLR